jgi:hypothetical protein
MIRSKLPRGRVSKALPPHKLFKTGLEWGLNALNTPEFDLRVKALILAAVLRYEAARDFGTVAAAATGKKEKRVDAAKEAASAAYAPPPPPPPPPMSFPERTLSS